MIDVYKSASEVWVSDQFSAVYTKTEEEGLVFKDVRIDVFTRCDSKKLKDLIRYVLFSIFRARKSPKCSFFVANPSLLREEELATWNEIGFRLSRSGTETWLVYSASSAAAAAIPLATTESASASDAAVLFSTAAVFAPTVGGVAFAATAGLAIASA